MMRTPQDIASLKLMIAEGVEENISLDYKAAEALQNTDSKKKEIAKDVSAMANSAGGIIIYGVKEFDSSEKKHLPEKITPINRCNFSKEQLEQIINNNISPKIDGLMIHPVQLTKTDEVVYVVEIPKSTTAHQNTRDFRYYRRYNFEAVPMQDYEIRDIMNRAKNPVMELNFVIEKFTCKVENIPLMPPLYGSTTEWRTDWHLRMIPVNKGNVYALYVNYFVELPEDIVDTEEVKYLNRHKEGVVEAYGENTYRDVVDTVLQPLGGSYNKYGPSRFDPILPGLRGCSEKIQLTQKPNLDKRVINWTIHADNASPYTGHIRLNEIEIIEKIEHGDE